MAPIAEKHIPPSFQGERWMPVVDASAYMVSSLGRLWSNRTRGKRVAVGLMQPPTNHHGYIQVSLILDDGHQTTRTLHRIVLEAFTGRRPDGMWARHLDGNKENCRLNNLRWDTPARNQRDKITHGTMARGVRHGMAKLTSEKVKEMRRLRSEGWLLRELSARYDVTIAAVSYVCRQKTWAQPQPGQAAA